MTNKNCKKTIKKKIPARVHVILARESKLAIVFRRGPSKQVATYLWDRSNDTFKLGQWLKGRIYERRSDLSIDGKYLIYFAMNGKWHSQTRGAWTAISKAPYLKAIELYTKGDCYEGGGLFLSKNRFWLNDRHFTKDKQLLDSKEVIRDGTYVGSNDLGYEDRAVYYPRLIRDGWKLISTEKYKKWHSVTIFEKSYNGWVLRKIAHEQIEAEEGRGVYWDEHELINKGLNFSLSYSDWEWADFNEDFVLWATKGCLYRSSLKARNIIKNSIMLYDFNSCRFKAIEAPY